MQYKQEPTEADKAKRLFADALDSIECLCGNRKASGRIVCYKCWGQLPAEMQRPLFAKAGPGAAQAYLAAYLRLTNPKGEPHEEKNPAGI